MAYQCKIDIFEGPLDLLLHLIKEQKMDINDIPIAEITRQYMNTVDLMQDLNLDIARACHAINDGLNAIFYIRQAKQLLANDKKGLEEAIDSCINNVRDKVSS